MALIGQMSEDEIAVLVALGVKLGDVGGGPVRRAKLLTLRLLLLSRQPLGLGERLAAKFSGRGVMS